MILSIAGAPIAYTLAPSTLSVSDIQIGDFSLTTGGFTVTQINDDDLGKIDFETYKKPRRDGGGVLSSYYRGRTITLSLSIVGTTPSDLQSKMDALKLGTSGVQTWLFVRNPIDTRRIRGKVQTIDFGRQHYNITFIKPKITFEAVDPFFEGLTNGSLTRTGDTAAWQDQFLHAGTANTLPTMYFVFGSTTSLTSATLVSGGNALTISSALTTGDILIVDSKKEKVTKNGVEIDSTGIFPEFSPGSTAISFSGVGTFSLDTSIVAPKTFL
jgi:hypothetical protein